MSRVRLPPRSHCFSTYPASNANYCSPPLCHACVRYVPSVLSACTSSIPTCPRVAYNSFQVRRLVDFVLSQPIDAIFARVIYSEFGMTFDRNITARYAARVTELESPRASTRFYALLFTTCVPRSRRRLLRPTVLLLCFAFFRRRYPLPSRSIRPCGATIVSYPLLRILPRV